MNPYEQMFANRLSDELDFFHLTTLGGILKSYAEHEDCKGFVLECMDGKVSLTIIGENTPQRTTEEIGDSYLFYKDPEGTFEGMKDG